MVKNLSALMAASAGLIILSPVFAAPPSQSPASAAKPILVPAKTAPMLLVAPPPSVSDILSSEIGSQRVLKLTLKTKNATDFVTIQGSEQAKFIAACVHFETDWYVVPIGFSKWIEPHDLSSSDAVQMLETNPREYKLERVHTYSDFPDDKILIAPEDVVKIEWVKLPLDLPPPTLPRRVPIRVNPSVFGLWP